MCCVAPMMDSSAGISTRVRTNLYESINVTDRGKSAQASSKCTGCSELPGPVGRVGGYGFVRPEGRDEVNVSSLRSQKRKSRRELLTAIFRADRRLLESLA